jgi:hypothetical protein
VSRDHVVRDAGERGHLRRYRVRGLIERGKDVPKAGEATVWQVVELDHPELDHLVLPLIKTGRLDIE